MGSFENPGSDFHGNTPGDRSTGERLTGGKPTTPISSLTLLTGFVCLLFGAGPPDVFAFALILGMIAGTYSPILLARSSGGTLIEGRWRLALPAAEKNDRVTSRR
jgi:hypothetical protein